MLKIVNPICIGQQYDVKDGTCRITGAILVGIFSHHLVFESKGISYSFSKASFLCGDAVLVCTKTQKSFWRWF